MKGFVFYIFAALMVAASVHRSCGQISQATEAVTEELISVMLRDGGRTAASELTELGGEAAVRALIERVSREGGEGLVDRVVQYCSRYGPSALKAIEPSPSLMIRAFDRLPPDLTQRAIRAAAREPRLLSRLVSAYGDTALEVAARQPGVGAALVEKLGEDGIRMSNHLTTDQAVGLARHAEDIAALPSAERSQLLDAILKAPAQVLDFLETHPKVLVTAGVVSAFIAAKENILGSTAHLRGHKPSSSGLVERVIYRLTDKFVLPMIAPMLILIGIGCYVMIRLCRMWKLNFVCTNSGPVIAAPEIGRRLKTCSPGPH